MTATVTELARDSERRHITVLFCDLVDSVALAHRLDPEELSEVIGRYHAACEEVVRRYDGHVAQYLGDGLLVYFGHPRAHEDDAQRAVRAALGIVGAIQAMQVRRPAGGAAPLAVRIGVHTGLVIVADVGGRARHNERLALGETPNVAARLQDIAAPDTVVVSERTRRIAGGAFEYADLGELPLRGVAHPIQAWRVLGQGVAVSRFEAATRDGLTPLVGRRHELGLFLDRWQLVREGIGQVVLISGEPGIGKSRLLSELREQLDTGVYGLIRMQCSPYHGDSAFHPIIDAVQRMLRFVPGESSATRLDKLEALVMQRYGRPVADLKLIAAMLSIDADERHGPLEVAPQRHKEETMRTLLDLVRAIGHEQPSLLIWEDLHWADPSTLDILRQLLDRCAGWPVLVVLTQRAAFPAGWLAHAHVAPLVLTRLSPSQSSAMVRRLAGTRPLPDTVVEHIVERTDGVPLFLEELTKAVLEAGAGEQAALIPMTLRDSLVSRLDRLPTTRLAAQVASAIGRDFSVSILREVAGLTDTALDEALRDLSEAGLVYVRPSVEGDIYRFKHALVQDAAYDSLLRRARPELHARIARVLEARSPELRQQRPEVLAHHYTEAGQAEPAVACWTLAGRHAAARFASVEAENHLRRALRLLRGMPPCEERDRRELDILVTLAPALVATRGYAAAAVEEVFEQAKVLAVRCGDASQNFAVQRGQFHVLLTQARHGRAHAAATALVGLADSEGDPAHRVDAHLSIGLAALYQGRFRIAQRHLDQGLTQHDPDRDRVHALRSGIDLGVMCRSYQARTLWFLGYPDSALARGREAMTVARQRGVSLSIAQSMGMLAVLYQVRDEVTEAAHWVDETIAYSDAQGLPYWASFCGCLKGWVDARQGRMADGVARIRAGLEKNHATGARLGHSWFLLLLADALSRAGESALCIATLREAWTTCQHHGEGYYAAEILRVWGDLTISQGGLAEGEALLQQALGAARAQQARSWVLRVANSLARLWIAQGRHAAAHALVAPVHAWFSEGRASLDMLEASRLLAAAARRRFE